MIASIYATIKFTVIDIKSGRFGRICNHQPPCSFFATTSNNDSQQTSILASPDNTFRNKVSPSISMLEEFEMAERPRSRADTFPNRLTAINRTVSGLLLGSLGPKLTICPELNRPNEFPNCTYNNIIIARTPDVKPR